MTGTIKVELGVATHVPTERELLVRAIKEAEERIAEIDSKAQMDFAATQMYTAYQAFLDAGFSKAQAWKLFNKTIGGML